MTDTDALVSELKCGKCGLPIERGESGVRYYGVFVAHSENRCLSLLHDALARLTRERDEFEKSWHETADQAKSLLYDNIELKAALSAARAELDANKSLVEKMVCLSQEMGTIRDFKQGDQIVWKFDATLGRRQAVMWDAWYHAALHLESGGVLGAPYEETIRALKEAPHV